MSPQQKAAEKTESVSSAVKRLREDADRLKELVQAEEQLMDTASRIPGPPEGCDAFKQARTRRDELLRQRCTALQQLSQILEDYNCTLEKENADLRESNERLNHKLKRTRNELKRAIGASSGPECGSDSNGDTGTEEKPAKGKSRSNGNKQRRRGAPKGHRGGSRPVPDQIDAEEVHPPAEKCECGCCSITPLYEYDAKYIEDIPPVCRVVTRKLYLRGQCDECGRTVRHPDAVHGPPTEIGSNLAVHATLMKQAGMTFGTISSFATHTLGVPLTESGALGLVNRVTDALTGTYNDIAEQLPEQAALNGDETGWKVLGQNCYIWCFCNRHLVYYHPDYRRSSEVIEQILGKDFAGVVMCDFYGAYNCVDKTQRCLVHLLRDIGKEREVLSDSKLLERFDQAVRDFINEGLRVKAMPHGIPKDEEIKKLEKKLDKITRMQVTKGTGETLVKRIARYRDELIRFVTHPGVEFHNNRAERQLRPMVISRKISFGNNTDRGALRHCILNSVVETCRLQQIDPVEFLTRAYTSGGLDVPHLWVNSPPAA